ncbi:MAG TPA: hypothetical protein VL978_00405, partial [Puia sp.]|nr:hypothetical protein [Puia sp.]
MYDIKPNLIIGFHGCDRRVRDTLLLNPSLYRISQQPYDWLGHGLYFWENNCDRALQWAVDKKARDKMTEPAVIGAVLHLGHCCDLLEQKYIKLLASYATTLKTRCEATGEKYPRNEDLTADTHKNKLL